MAINPQTPQQVILKTDAPWCSGACGQGCHALTVAPLQSLAAPAQRNCGGSSSIMQALSSMLVHLPLVPAWLCFRCWRKWSAR